MSSTLAEYYHEHNPKPEWYFKVRGFVREDGDFVVVSNDNLPSIKYASDSLRGWVFTKLDISRKREKS